ncbi:MAG: diacylglycerol kinase [Thermoanaerobacteraceae bacterium]
MKSKNLIDSFNYAIDGIFYAFKTQRNMKIHFALAIIVLVFSLFFNLSKLEFIEVVFAIAFVLIAEMVNTAIETTVDMMTDKFHPLAKIAKNVAAGAVLISAVNALIIAYLIFFDRINPFTKIILVKIRESPIHVTFISLIVVILLTIIFKVHFKEGTPMKGGMPSAHSAVAFCLATAVTFMSSNTLIGTISFFLAFMVGQSRIEGKIHNFLQVLIGALLGIIITIIFFQIVKY